MKYVEHFRMKSPKKGYATLVSYFSSYWDESSIFILVKAKLESETQIAP